MECKSGLKVLTAVATRQALQMMVLGSCGNQGGRRGICFGSYFVSLVDVLDGAREVVLDVDLAVLGTLVVDVALVCTLADRCVDGIEVGVCHLCNAIEGWCTGV